MPLICFASPKGGVGKTTLAANVAGFIARSGARVIALDLDPQNALRLHFGVPLNEQGGLTAHLAQQPNWQSAVRPTGSGVHLLAYGATDMPRAMQLSVQVAQTPTLLSGPVSEMLSDPSVWLVADTAPGPSPMLAALLPLTDLLVSVLLVDATSVSLIPTLESGSAYGSTGGGQQTNQGVVLNQLDTRTRLGRPIAEAAIQHLGKRLLGIVYRDEHVAEAVAAQKLVTDYAPAAKAAQDIAAVGREVMARLPSAQPRQQSGWSRR
jgi:cellulose synthase operon protein YhjQ